MDARIESPFPAGLPQHLAAAAFVSGEPAWKQADCAGVIGWLRASGYAVLGWELWLVTNGAIHTLMSTGGGRVLYSASYEPLLQEGWDEYVQRSARLAAEGVLAFRWPEDSTESPDTVPYFNLTWADRDWFRSRGKFQDR
jgi:hypothetical protein